MRHTDQRTEKQRQQQQNIIIKTHTMLSKLCNNIDAIVAAEESSIKRHTLFIIIIVSEGHAETEKRTSTKVQNATKAKITIPTTTLRTTAAIVKTSHHMSQRKCGRKVVI